MTLTKFLALAPAAVLGVALMGAAPAQAGTGIYGIYDHKPAHAQTRTTVGDLGCTETTIVLRRTRHVSYFGGSTWLADHWRHWRIVSVDTTTIC